MIPDRSKVFGLWLSPSRLVAIFSLPSPAYAEISTDGPWSSEEQRSQLDAPLLWAQGRGKAESKCPKELEY